MLLPVLSVFNHGIKVVLFQFYQHCPIKEIWQVIINNLVSSIYHVIYIQTLFTTQQLEGLEKLRIYFPPITVPCIVDSTRKKSFLHQHITSQYALVFRFAEMVKYRKMSKYTWCFSFMSIANDQNRGTWLATVHGVSKSQTQLSDKAQPSTELFCLIQN